MYSNTSLYAALVIPVLAITSQSCCSVCTKSVSVTPTIEDSGSGDKATTKKGVAAVITFEECKDKSLCLATKALNKQMKRATKSREKGLISAKAYEDYLAMYVDAVTKIAAEGKVTSGTLPTVKTEQATGRSSLGPAIFPGDYRSDRAYEISLSAAVYEAADVIESGLGPSQ